MRAKSWESETEAAPKDPLGFRIFRVGFQGFGRIGFIGFRRILVMFWPASFNFFGGSTWL